MKRNVLDMKAQSLAEMIEYMLKERKVIPAVYWDEGLNVYYNMGSNPKKAWAHFYLETTDEEQHRSWISMPVELNGYSSYKALAADIDGLCWTIAEQVEGVHDELERGADPSTFVWNGLEFQFFKHILKEQLPYGEYDEYLNAVFAASAAEADEETVEDDPFKAAFASPEEETYPVFDENGDPALIPDDAKYLEWNEPSETPRGPVPYISRAQKLAEEKVQYWYERYCSASKGSFQEELAWGNYKFWCNQMD